MEPDKRKIDLVGAGGHPRKPKASKTVPVQKTDPPAVGRRIPPFGMLLLSARARARFEAIMQSWPYSTCRPTHTPDARPGSDSEARLEERLNQDRMLTATAQERINADRMLGMERRVAALVETVHQLEESHAQLMVSHALQLEEHYGHQCTVHVAPVSSPAAAAEETSS